MYEDTATGTVAYRCTRVYKDPSTAKAQNTRNSALGHSVIVEGKHIQLKRIDFWVEEATGWTRV